MLPVSSHLGQKHQEHPVRFGTGRSFHLSVEDNELLTEERVLCYEFVLLLTKSVSVPSISEVGPGFAQTMKRWWSD